MGKTAMSGPVYGAKSLLWYVQQDVLAVSTAAVTIAGLVVPPGEDWYVTSLHAWRGSTHSTLFTAALIDDSTTVGTVAVPSSLANAAGSTIMTPDGGEYEGKQVFSGSSLTIAVANGNSSVAASSGVRVWVYGYIRWLPSTARTE